MAQIPLERTRNIGIIAHIDAGKTTTTERILFYTGREHRMGEVDEGTATMDWMDEERERGITITAAATTTTWRVGSGPEHRINIVDTPGHVDFTAEVERSLRVLDGAIGIFCGVSGVEAQSYSVWRRADRYKVPRLAFVNKLDRIGADFDRVVADIEASLKANTLVLTIHMGLEKDFVGVIDVIRQKALSFDEESKGRTVLERDIPEEHVERARAARERLFDKLSAVDDTILEKLVHHGEVSEDEVHAAIRRATLASKGVPTFAGASFRNKGVQPLIDAIVRYLPSPLEAGSVFGMSPDGKKKIERKPDPGEPLCALAFKTQIDPHGELTWLRIYSGSLETGEQVYNPREQKKERIGRLIRMHANQRETVDEAATGDIVAATGLKSTVTGDTLCPVHQAVVLERMDFPETVISLAIEPSTTAERDKLLDTLRKLAREDPTFEHRLDDETGQIIMSGMGELHLEVLSHRIEREFNIDARIGKPRVSYRQTICGPAVAEGRFERETAQRRLFGAVTLRLSPWEPPAGARDRVRFESRLRTGVLPKELVTAVEDGARSAAGSGGTLGYPIINLRIELVDAEHHPQDSVDTAYVAAATYALNEASEKAGLKVLEPVMRLEVQTPNEYYGNIVTDLQSRRAEITDMDVHGDMRVVRGVVPLAEMFGYSTTIRSLSQGRATFTMEPHTYGEAPASARPSWA